MASSVVLGLTTALILTYLGNWYLAFRRNINKAKKSGIPYIVVPCFPVNRIWLLTNPLWLKIARTALPKKWVDPWYDYCTPDLPWLCRHEPFERQGSDTILTVSGGGIMLWTADATVINQITTRKNDFPKPTRLYGSVDIYGKNVLTTEGAEWRRHRKMTSPPFVEKNYHLVWADTLDQAQAMLSSWVGPDRAGGRVDRLMDDTQTLTLHVISRAGFGRKLPWPTSSEDGKDASTMQNPHSKIENRKSDMDEGHSMSYLFAMHALLDNLLLIFIFGKGILRKSPFKVTTLAYTAFNEWGDYMREMVSSKKAAIYNGLGLDDMDIMGQLVKGQVLGSKAKASGKDAPLTDSEILGNAFILILAGHETTANSIFFSMLLLAMNPSSQRALQADLTSHFGSRPVSEWDYDRDLPFLFGSMAGAIMNEELRLIPPAINIPKSTIGVPDQPLTVNNRACTVPAESFVNLCAPAVHRNPKFWPHGPPRDPEKPEHHLCNTDNDLEEFKPQRWLLDPGSVPTGPAPSGLDTPSTTAAGAGDALNVNTSADTAASLYRPVKGAFIPFSDGFRACLGRRFAQVEVLAALAVIFAEYSIELDVSAWADAEQIEKWKKGGEAGRKELEEVWWKARAESERLIRGSTTVITLQMRDGTVPVRLVKRGKEVFGNYV